MNEFKILNDPTRGKPLRYSFKGCRALSKNTVIYHRGERRARRVLRRFQSLLRFSGAFAFSVCSAVKFRDLAISLENSTVPFNRVDSHHLC